VEGVERRAVDGGDVAAVREQVELEPLGRGVVSGDDDGG